LYAKMPGDHWQKLANLRALLAYQVTRPGKSLLFMGTELAQPDEWNHDISLPWHLRETPDRGAFVAYVAALGAMYRQHSAFWQCDGETRGFEWIDIGDRANSVVSYLRRSNDGVAVVVLNLTPTPHGRYRVGVPDCCSYDVALSTDATEWGGSGYGYHTGAIVHADDIPYHGRRYSVDLALPPLSVLVLIPTRPGAHNA
jgi:1,4-alpha-glucan branching enzyme